ncbi:abortive phage infection protein [Hylemonella gracilis str. Niagara R]|uniref:Abortive phage infection protein n=1 Tax=Hylemonella gracilis str. Niagara R TaxID=1458275 RepID=A0A016XDN0_9BURK|nr:AIPR family protein [Hylemonella gracilis]EYC49677.1 abortive phage infection protein [Hylemonella gracilis str. Niagara R]
MSTAILEFLNELQDDIDSQVSEEMPIEEYVFSDIVMNHLADAGMTYNDPVVCHYKGRTGNAILRLSGYSISEDEDQLDLFISLYEGVREIAYIPEGDTKTAVEQCLRFLTLCANGTMAAKLEDSSDERELAVKLQQIYDGLDQIRVFVLTDKVAKTKSFKPREINGKTVRLEVMDTERLYRQVSEGKPRDELIANFNELCGAPLPCVFVPGSDGEDYDYALAAIPAIALQALYAKFDSRLLEANVRSFLSIKGKGVNAGIQSTLRYDPGRFMAYNNGIVVVADHIALVKSASGSDSISLLRGLQIVNGGQTTASIFFTKRKFPETDLSRVFVPAKIIVMRTQDPVQEETLISDISRYANSQNAVKQSDLSANKPFHIAIEKLSRSVYCPDGVSQWFYERAAGSYNTLLSLSGNTPAKLKALKESIPPARRITKTDLARYLNTWDVKPDVVSLGTQKNFDKFMAELTATYGQDIPEPKVADFKAMMVKAKIYRDAQKLMRPMFAAFQVNVATYTVSLLAQQLGDRIDLDRIWNNQALSPELLRQIATWSREVNDALRESAHGKMVSEWAKKPECKAAVLGATYSAPAANIPEVKTA